MPETERQFLAFMAIPNTLGIAALMAGSDDEALDVLAALTAEKPATADDEAEGLRARLDDLRQLRAEGRETAQARLDAAQAAANRLADSLIVWIQTPDWGASEQYLHKHAADLLTELASAPGVDAKHKLKVTIPIVPVLLSYEGEIELSSRLDLAEVWRALLRRIDRPNANHFDPDAPDRV